MEVAELGFLFLRAAFFISLALASSAGFSSESVSDAKGTLNTFASTADSGQEIGSRDGVLAGQLGHDGGVPTNLSDSTSSSVEDRLTKLYLDDNPTVLTSTKQRGTYGSNPGYQMCPSGYEPTDYEKDTFRIRTTCSSRGAGCNYNTYDRWRVTCYPKSPEALRLHSRW